MSHLHPASFLFLALTLCACSATPVTTSVSSPALPEGQRIGEPVEAQEILRFAAVDADPAAHFERTLLVEATVVAVCQTKGCWMQIEDDGRTARVRWEEGCGGRYAFPKDAAGRRMVIQGSFYPTTISEADARHMEEESDRPIEVPLEGYEFNASAVILLDEDAS